MAEDWAHDDSIALHERITELEVEIAHLSKQVEELVHVLGAAKGAFQVLAFLGKVAKPVLWITGMVTVIATGLSKYKS
jgi:hypothetical protein